MWGGYDESGRFLCPFHGPDSPCAENETWANHQIMNDDDLRTEVIEETSFTHDNHDIVYMEGRYYYDHDREFQPATPTLEVGEHLPLVYPPATPSFGVSQNGNDRLHQRQLSYGDDGFVVLEGTTGNAFYVQRIPSRPLLYLQNSAGSYDSQQNDTALMQDSVQRLMSEQQKEHTLWEALEEPQTPKPATDTARQAPHQTHTGERPFKCNICQDMFVYIHHLESHCLNHHGYHPSAELSIYGCGFCSKVFMYSRHLQDHVSVHSDTANSSLRCPLCETFVKVKRSLVVHIQQTHRESSLNANILADEAEKKLANRSTGTGTVVERAKFTMKSSELATVTAPTSSQEMLSMMRPNHGESEAPATFEPGEKANHSNDDDHQKLQEMFEDIMAELEEVDSIPAHTGENPSLCNNGDSLVLSEGQL